MSWHIPAKTFLLGEYSALFGKGALVLTTLPCFAITITADNSLEGISPHSPAGQWWLKQRFENRGLHWHDPYQGKGGLGASSAQFIGAYLASNPSNQNLSSLLAAYKLSLSRQGFKPSGYDVIAQTQNHCVYVHRQNNIVETYPWHFNDIGFLLLHSGQKLPTHEHLQTLSPTLAIKNLPPLVEQAKKAFINQDSEALTDAINQYQQELIHLNLMAPLSAQHVLAFRKQPGILAAKGCGALGADVFLLIIARPLLEIKAQALAMQGWTILATSADLYTGRGLLENKSHKTLEILP